MLDSLFFLTLALILGGMVAFQLLFAPLLFTALDIQIARRFIRRFFPWYYLYFALLTGVALALALWQEAIPVAGWLTLCLAGFLWARQWLMPRANAASDRGDTPAFHRIHRTTVVINALQLVLLGYLLW